MIRRFSLYGFLKNQRYYEPFIILAFLEKGLSFFDIGLLIAFREIIKNLLEIPSGAIADIYGRRRAMILSFAAYIVSFIIFGGADSIAFLFLAMFFYGVGEAFRTGTHKAMIFSWLSMQGRAAAGTKVYGFTRSWSKLGSATSVILAAILVFTSSRYSYIFYFSIIPYILGIINFLGYPAILDNQRQKEARFADIVRHLKETVRDVLKQAAQRRLIIESMCFDGVFEATKDYLQPILKSAALLLIPGMLLSMSLNEPQQAALFIGPVYFLLYILAALASRQAHIVVRLAGCEQNCVRLMWGLNLLVFAALVPAMYYQNYPAMICGFVFLHVLHNCWRPVLISRFDRCSSERKKATVLSIESQAKSFATIIAAPLLGLAVDLVRHNNIGGEYWPIGVLGLVVSLYCLLTTASSKQSAAPKGNCGTVRR